MFFFSDGPEKTGRNTSQSNVTSSVWLSENFNFQKCKNRPGCMRMVRCIYRISLFGFKSPTNISNLHSHLQWSKCKTWQRCQRNEGHTLDTLSKYNMLACKAFLIMFIACTYNRVHAVNSLWITTNKLNFLRWNWLLKPILYFFYPIKVRCPYSS